MILSKEYGLILFHLDSVWLDRREERRREDADKAGARYRGEVLRQDLPGGGVQGAVGGLGDPPGRGRLDRREARAPAQEDPGGGVQEEAGGAQEVVHAVPEGRGVPQGGPGQGEVR